MALWGNNDNVGSAGTVSLNYATRVVTGTGTSFGIAGGLSEGDVIRFGTRGGGGIYYGDAVVVSVASSESLTIGSTMGLSGVAIAGTDFTVSQLPKSSVLDSSYSETNFVAPSYTNIFFTSATIEAPAGFTTVALNDMGTDVIQVGDHLVSASGVDTPIASIGTTGVVLGSPIGAGLTINAGTAITFTRLVDGYDKLAYGISTATTGSYHVSHEGWVGVQTYIDNHGNFRVKSETLVAMSGISTGDGSIAYPTPV
jgi:hypothetical protein